MGKTVSANLSLRLSDGVVRQLIRDTRTGNDTTGEFFKTGTILVDSLGTFIADVKSFIMLETEFWIEVTYLLDGVWSRQIVHSMLLIYGGIGRVWVRNVSTESPTTRVNFYISTDDGEPSGFIDIFLNEENESVQSKIDLKVLPTRTNIPDLGLPVKESSLTFGIQQVTFGIPAQLYQGQLKDVPVHLT